MDKQTLLYALSTLAQTCAALAALIGALGLYRLQFLSWRHQDVERSIRGWLGVIYGVHTKYMEMPRQKMLEEASETVKSPPAGKEEEAQEIKEARRQLDRFGPDDRRCRCFLVVFEAVNLFFILVALVGFNYVCFLLKWPCTTYWGLLLAAVGTFLVTVLMLLEISDFFARRALRRVEIREGRRR